MTGHKFAKQPGNRPQVRLNQDQGQAGSPSTGGAELEVENGHLRQSLLTNDADLQRFFAQLIEELLRDEK